MPYHAHRVDHDDGTIDRQTLDDHLTAVATLASGFAAEFGAAEWGRVAGLWHDLGKYSREFQARLEGDDAFVDHKSAGAQHAVAVLDARGMGKLLAYCIAGHHGGLHDGVSNDHTSLADHLTATVPDWSAAPDDLLHPATNLAFPLPIDPRDQEPLFRISVFTRMLYSCLVDADFLDTEAFMTPEKHRLRGGYPTLPDIGAALDAHLAALAAQGGDTPVNRRRADVLAHCREAATGEPGFFSLTVPTGGGKTLSSLAFAVRHALRHERRRIIYAIPFTSIIEQTAKVFREALDPDHAGISAVLEHHSNFDAGDDDAARLATENWDAPLVVTTNVQFFESLFHNKPSRCRRLHAIANSVVILDEAQTLPVRLIRPCLEVLRELVTSYGVTVVLCTATQPALTRQDGFSGGLDGVREIIPKPEELYRAMKRVRVSLDGRVPDDELAARLAEHERVLCIVNTRRHARELYRKVADRAECRHLSALMCPAHRAAVLTDVRAVLKCGEPCRLISTQLIEAGVDVDFPVVFRAAAGVDSIAQAAGRCNREGHLAAGEMHVFDPGDGLPPGDFRRTASAAEGVYRVHDNDPLSLDAVRDYFKEWYWLNEDRLDEHHILDMIHAANRKGDIPFRTIAEIFRFIEDGSLPLIIPWEGEGKNVVAALELKPMDYRAVRRAQRYTVQIPPRVMEELRRMGMAALVNERFWVLRDDTIYHKDVGLDPPGIDVFLSSTLIS